MSQLLIGIILSIGVAGYYHYTDCQEDLYILRNLNKAYELKHEQQEEALQALQKDFELQTDALKQMQVTSQQIEAEMARYLDIFKRHNLTKLAAAKPGLIELRVNKATKGVFDGIEKDSISLDALDDGMQFATPSSATGSQNNNETSGASDSTASTAQSN